MKVFEFGNEQSDLILIQMVDSHSIKIMDSEVELIRNLSGRDDFRLVAFQVEDWNRDLSPWEATAGGSALRGEKMVEYKIASVLRWKRPPDHLNDDPEVQTE